MFFSTKAFECVLYLYKTCHFVIWVCVDEPIIPQIAVKSHVGGEFDIVLERRRKKQRKISKIVTSVRNPALSRLVAAIRHIQLGRLNRHNQNCT